MRCTSWLLGSALFGLIGAAQAAVDPALLDRPAPTPIRASKIVLVGDSTTAVQGGWGPAFCARHVTSFLTCTNLARGGRSTYNYRAEGSWALAEAEMRTPGYARTWVLVQFGHNDQPGKPGRSTELQREFPDNLRRYVREIRAAGAQPVLLTPLTRRQFADGVLIDDLAPWAEAVRTVAIEMQVPLVDLHARSRVVVQALEPGQFVGEFLRAQRIAVGQIDGGHAHRDRGLDQGLQIAGLFIAVVAGQAAPHVRQRVFRQQGDAVVALLTVRLDVVAQVLEGLARELLVHALDLLEAGDVRIGGLNPLQHRRQAGVDRVHVPGGDAHGIQG